MERVQREEPFCVEVVEVVEKFIRNFFFFLEAKRVGGRVKERRRWGPI